MVLWNLQRNYWKALVHSRDWQRTIPLEPKSPLRHKEIVRHKLRATSRKWYLMRCTVCHSLWNSANKGQKSAKSCCTANVGWTICCYHKINQMTNEYARMESSQYAWGLWCGSQMTLNHCFHVYWTLCEYVSCFNYFIVIVVFFALIASFLFINLVALITPLRFWFL
jgi:hypothetical protein